MIDLISEIIQTMRNNRLRTALTGFAVAWGIFMLIVLLGMSRGVYNGFHSFASADNSMMINVWPGYTTKPYKGYKEGRAIELNEADKSIIKSRGGRFIDDVRAIIVLDSSRVSTGRDYIASSVYGHFPGEDRRAKLKIIHGRFLNQRDLDEKRKVIVLEEKNARLLFDDESQAVGKRIDCMGLSWLVIGVYSHRWETGSYVPFSTAMALQSPDGKVSEMMIYLHNVETTDDGDQAETDVRQSIASAHDYASDDEGGIYLWNRFNHYLRNNQALSILDMAVWIIGFLTLLSGIVGVSNIMFVSVRERTHEIGIRRAIGAKPRSILSQIIAESVALTTFFGYIGIVAGTLVTGILSKVFEDGDFLKDPTVNLHIAFEVTVVLIAAGALAGLFPALKALKVKPVEALRDE